MADSLTHSLTVYCAAKEERVDLQEHAEEWEAANPIQRQVGRGDAKWNLCLAAFFFFFFFQVSF